MYNYNFEEPEPALTRTSSCVSMPDYALISPRASARLNPLASAWIPSSIRPALNPRAVPWNPTGLRSMESSGRQPVLNATEYGSTLYQNAMLSPPSSTLLHEASGIPIESASLSENMRSSLRPEALSWMPTTHSTVRTGYKSDAIKPSDAIPLPYRRTDIYGTDINWNGSVVVDILDSPTSSLDPFAAVFDSDREYLSYDQIGIVEPTDDFRCRTKPLSPLAKHWYPALTRAERDTVPVTTFTWDEIDEILTRYENECQRETTGSDSPQAFNLF